VTGQLPVIFLMGPTASGKTELAVAIRHHLPCEIISVDSAMVYRGMDIGTAKPDKALLAEAPHRLIDICDPAAVYSVARFREDALTEISAVQRSGRIPLLVGGTGLYFRTLEQGISELPAADEEIRHRMKKEADAKGWEYLYQRLAQVDPDAAVRIHPNDSQRIQRALEIYEITGRSMTDHFTDGRRGALPFNVFKIILAPDDRQIIHERVKVRFLQMLDAGLLDEVRGLYGRGDLNASLPSMRMVGYRQIWRYLEGELAYEQMCEYAIVATRQLAKRQITWCRSEQNARWFDSSDRNMLDKILKSLQDNPDFSCMCNILTGT
jgi:tRNA dimethylallyltransferase